MKKIQFVFMAGLAMLTGCIQEDLSWKALLKEQKDRTE